MKKGVPTVVCCRGVGKLPGHPPLESTFWLHTTRVGTPKSRVGFNTKCDYLHGIRGLRWVNPNFVTHELG